MPQHTSQVAIPELWCWFFADYYDVTVKLSFYLLDIKSLIITLVITPPFKPGYECVCMWCVYIYRYVYNLLSYLSYELLSAKKVFCEVTVTMTFDQSNLTTSSLIPSGQLPQTWRNSLEVFLRYCIHKNETTWDDSDLWLLKSNQFILESLCTFVPHLKTFSEGVRKIAFTRTGRMDIHMDTWTDKQTTSKHKASGHSWCQRGYEKKKRGPW